MREIRFSSNRRHHDRTQPTCHPSFHEPHFCGPGSEGIGFPASPASLWWIRLGRLRVAAEWERAEKADHHPKAQVSESHTPKQPARNERGRQASESNQNLTEKRNCGIMPVNASALVAETHDNRSPVHDDDPAGHEGEENRQYGEKCAHGVNPSSARASWLR